MSYSPKQIADFNQQIDELIATVRERKLNASEIFHIFSVVPDPAAAMMVMALMLVRLEKAERDLAGLRKDGLAF